MVGEVLGFPADAQDRFTYWYTSIQKGLRGSEFAKAGLEARQDLEDYVWELVKERRREPTFLYDEAANPPVRTSSPVEPGQDRRRLHVVARDRVDDLGAGQRRR